MIKKKKGFPKKEDENDTEDSSGSEIEDDEPILQEFNDEEKSDINQFNLKGEEVIKKKETIDFLPQFSRSAGPIYNYEPTAEPIEYFYDFITENFMQSLAQYTNEYAKTKIQSFPENSSPSHEKSGEEVTNEEMKCFIGIILLMGIIRLPEYTDYWSSKSLLNIISIKELMSRDRFKQISRYFHINSPSQESSTDKYTKIRPALDMILFFSQKNYVPSQMLSIDESMIGFKGHHSDVVYMPNKPIKKGFKAYVLTEARTGYICNGFLFTHNNSDEISNTTVSIVTKLLHGYENAGYIVAMDRFYTTVELFKVLEAIKIGAVGTINSNRKNLPKEKFQSLKMEINQSVFFQSENLILCCFQDKKRVLLISNCHDTIKIYEQRIFTMKKQKVSKFVGIPKILKDYTKYMGGVDRFDQFIHYYASSHRSLKGYKRIFYYLLEWAIVNATVIYEHIMQKNGDKPLSHKEFRLNIIKNLVKPTKTAKNLLETEKKKKSDKKIMEIIECRLEKSPQSRAYCAECPSRTSYGCGFHEIAVCAAICYDNHRKKYDLNTT